MTTRKPRELTYTAAVEKLRALALEQARETHAAVVAAEIKVETRYRAKFAAVLSRVPETIRGAVEQAAGVAGPEGEP